MPSQAPGVCLWLWVTNARMNDTEGMTTMNQKTDPSTQNIDRLLSAFAGKRFIFWTLVAIAIHAVIIGMTSLTYIRDTYIDLEGAVERKALAEAEQKRKEKAEAAAAAAALIGTNGVAGAAGDTNAAATASGTTNAPAGGTTNALSARYMEGIPEEARGSAVVGRMTDVASPEEMPKMGNDPGFTLEDINIGDK